MKKSKCEKAAWKYTKSIYGNTVYYEEEVVGDFHAFIKGAEALLRYAKKNSEDIWEEQQVTCGMVPYELLEEWVKGEK